MAAELERVNLFGEWLDSLFAPTPAQQWLERAVAEIDHQRDPDGSRKHRRDKVVLQLLQRDGDECWFCGRPMGRDVSLEHLQPLALGGNWSNGNLALAHSGCNKAAGHLSRIKKEELREQMRANQSTARDGDAANNSSPQNQ